ncbi:MAG: patatin-like phospholipase family protein [Candidatus Neomarinimicrobiota bacterium]
MSKEKNEKNLALGIALGGGGARGAAHIGVLQKIKEAGIKVDLISGVSSGSVIAAMFAFSEDPFWIEDKFRKLWLKSDFISKKKMTSVNDKSISFAESFKKKISDHYTAIHNLHKNSLVDTFELEEAIKTLLPINNFSELKIPLKVVATNLNNGEDVVYERGDLIGPLVQSCSIPGIFSPIIKRSKVISDGGVGMPIPITVIKDICNFTIVIDIGQYKLNGLDSSNAKSITKRANIITSNRLKSLLSLQADFVIRPDTLGKEWSDFNACEDLLIQGRKSAENIMNELTKSLKKKISNLEH